MKRELIGCLSGGRPVSIVNLVTNGNFNGNVSGWFNSGLDSFSAWGTNEAIAVANSQSDYFGQTQSTISGHVYYYCGWIKAWGTSISIVFSDNVDTANSVTFSGTYGTYQFLSSLYTASRSVSDALIYLIDGRASGWDNFLVKYVSRIDLTACFGAGNEPTKAQMDAIMADFANNWLNGTQTIMYNG